MSSVIAFWQMHFASLALADCLSTARNEACSNVILNTPQATNKLQTETRVLMISQCFPLYTCRYLFKDIGQC